MRQGGGIDEPPCPRVTVAETADDGQSADGRLRAGSAPRDAAKSDPPVMSVSGRSGHMYGPPPAVLKDDHPAGKEP